MCLQAFIDLQTKMVLVVNTANQAQVDIVELQELNVYNGAINAPQVEDNDNNDEIFEYYVNPPGWRRARLQRLPSGEWRRIGRLRRVGYNYD